MNKYLEKIAEAKWKAMGKVLKTVASNMSLPNKHLYSKAFTKNVDKLINSRAAHPDMARPYADYVSLSGTKNSKDAILHRINHFRDLPDGVGW